MGQPQQGDGGQKFEAPTVIAGSGFGIRKAPGRSETSLSDRLRDSGPDANAEPSAGDAGGVGRAGESIGPGCP